MDYIDYYDISNKKLSCFPSKEDLSKLLYLNCSSNKLIYFVNIYKLPINLLVFNCSNNILISLPFLNENLKELKCDKNYLININTDNNILPDNLIKLNCSRNRIIALPKLNDNLKELICYDNNIITKPILNDKIVDFWAWNNKFNL